MLNCIENIIITFNFGREKLEVNTTPQNAVKIYSCRGIDLNHEGLNRLVYNKLPTNIETIKELYLISDFDEEIFIVGILSFISKILDFPKEVKILNTIFNEPNKDLMKMYTRNGYDFYSHIEAKNMFDNKSFLINKLYYSDNHYMFNDSKYSTEEKNISYNYLRNIYKNKKRIAIFREDAQTGKERKLTNTEDVQKLFEKYDFYILKRLDKYDFQEKTIILNQFDTIFFEGGAGLSNLLFLEDNNQKIYSLDPPTYSPSHLDKVINKNIQCLDIGEIDTKHENYNKSHDPLNEPWYINIDKLNKVLRNL